MIGKVRKLKDVDPSHPKAESELFWSDSCLLFYIQFNNISLIYWDIDNQWQERVYMLNFKGGDFYCATGCCSLGVWVLSNGPRHLLVHGHLLLQARGTEDLFLFAPCGPFDLAIHLNWNVRACINTKKNKVQVVLKTVFCMKMGGYTCK